LRGNDVLVFEHLVVTGDPSILAPVTAATGSRLPPVLVAVVVA
jgi:hypothetical protein